MKKIFILVTIVMLMTPVLFSKQVGATTEEQKRNLLGYTYNLARDGYFDASYLSVSSIFNDNFLEERRRDAAHRIVKKTTSYVAQGSSYKSLQEDMSFKIGLASSVEGTYDGVTLCSNDSFRIGSKEIIKNYQSQLYYKKVHTYIVDSYCLSDLHANSSTYVNNLKSNYLEDLSQLSIDKSEYIEFFDRYGTHVLAAGNYGWQMDATYSILSDEYNFSSAFEAEMTRQMSVGLEGLGNMSTSLSVGFDSNMETSDSETKIFFNAVGYGGIDFDVMGQENFSVAYEEWKASVESNQALIAPTPVGGLLPLWDLLPSEYSYLRANMMNAYTYYAQQIVDSQEEQYRYLPGNKFHSKYAYVRFNEKKITDSGRFKQCFDVIDIGGYNMVDFATLDPKYRFMDVEIKLKVKESYDGFQSVFLFSSLEKSNDYLFNECKFEHSPNKKNDNYKSVEITFRNIPIENVVNNFLYLRYGASGHDEDTWYSKDIVAKIIYKDSDDGSIGSTVIVKE